MKVLAGDADGDGVREWRFPTHSFTLMAITTRFLARGEAMLGADGKPTASYDVHLDEPDPSRPPAGARLRRLLWWQLVLPRQLLLRGRPPCIGVAISPVGLGPRRVPASTVRHYSMRVSGSPSRVAGSQSGRKMGDGFGSILVQPTPTRPVAIPSRVGCSGCNDASLTDVGVALAICRIVSAALEATARCGDYKRSLVAFA
uniref:Uncharacterized protein n=1 Tax=Oryza brachyantha TaxID=4533 RepID=J3LDA0_ORYBR